MSKKNQPSVMELINKAKEEAEGKELEKPEKKVEPNEKEEGSAAKKETKPAVKKSTPKKDSSSSMKSLVQMIEDYSPDRSIKTVSAHLYPKDRDLLKKLSGELGVTLFDLNAAIINHILREENRSEVEALLRKSMKELL